NTALQQLDAVEQAVITDPAANPVGQLSGCAASIQTFAGTKNAAALAVASATPDGLSAAQSKLQIITAIEQTVVTSINGYAQTILGEFASAQGMAQSSMPAPGGTIPAADLTKALSNIQNSLIKPKNPPSCSSLTNPI